MRLITLLLGLLLLLPVAVFGQDANECNGPYKGKKPSVEEIKLVLLKHAEWSNETAEDEHENSTDPRRANFCGADLSGADLVDAALDFANLSGTNLSGADLTNAFLIRANLIKANLSGADLSGAVLTDAFLTDAWLADANLTGAAYVPDPEHHPTVGSIANAKGLSELTYFFPEELVTLRKLFRDGGYRNQERQITYSINHVRNTRLLNNNKGLEDYIGPGEGLVGQVEGAFNYLLFELTTKWGMEPSRALLAIAIFILVFSLIYLNALTKPEKDGIWRIWSNERVRKDLGKDEPELISAKGFSSVKLALYFSLLSAFNIGWRDLNVGNWIARIQPREYTLRASGWVRTVSGIQSLLSVYLLAIWALTYFGRPFE